MSDSTLSRKLTLISASLCNLHGVGLGKLLKADGDPALSPHLTRSHDDRAMKDDKLLRLAGERCLRQHLAPLRLHIKTKPGTYSPALPKL